MSERDRKDDIQIGDQAWIDYISIDGNYADAIDIDAALDGLWPLICRLETHCDAGCCGIDAYDFTRAAIDAVLPELDRAPLHVACSQAQAAVAAAAGDVLLSSTMNHLAHKRVFLQLLAHMGRCIAEPQTGQAPSQQR